MPSASEIVERHVADLIAEARPLGLAEETIGRALLDSAVALLSVGRSPEQVAEELSFIAANLGGDEEYAFMRP